MRTRHFQYVVFNNLIFKNNLQTKQQLSSLCYILKVYACVATDQILEIIEQTPALLQVLMTRVSC